MPKLHAHPSQDELSAYSLGQLPEEKAVAIDAHISKCDPCCETIIELSTNDTFSGLLQEAARLPTDQTVDHESLGVKSSSGEGDIPPELANHPRYQIVRLIGKGGMGDVYEAIHRKMERRVALKVINRELFQKAEAVNRFHREVKAAAQLAHPNVVTSHDADQAGDFHFMVMEYVDGVDLSQTIKKRGALPVAEACDYIRQAAIGLQHAHECGMVHRDIKPHNLMVTADGTIKILDFGLASLAPEATPASDVAAARSDLTAVGAIMGTPDFISPEQANDARQADIRSDIYSLGATLYYLLSGQVPFAEGSVMHKLKSHAHVEPESLGSLRDDVPGELVAIVSKMMAKNPNERYLTPSAVAEALQPFCQSVEPEQAVAPRTQAITRRWLPKFLSRTSAAVLFVAALFAGFTYFLQTNDGVLSFQRVPSEDSSTIGTHPLTIVDTSGKKPLGGTSGTHQDDAAGITTHSFESANGRYKISLVNEVLTVNGDKYILENPTDAIRIVDDRVEITRVAELPKNGEDELKLLQGAWETVSVTEGGKTLTNEKGFSGLLLQIKGNQFVIAERKPNGEKARPNTGRIEIDRAATPKTIDFINRDQPNQRSIGIFEIKDGTLRICLVEQGGTDPPRDGRIPDAKPLKRPTTFDSPVGSNMMLMEFTESKPAKENDISKIQGIWQVSYSEDGGRIAPQEMLKEIRFVIDTQNLTTEIGGRKSVSKYKLDPSTNPKSIDFTENGYTKQGIYDLVGDTLRICIAETGEQRPTAFDSQPNSVNDVVLILKRVQPEEASSADTDDHLHAGPMSPKLARSLIPVAASISNKDFEMLQANPSAAPIKNKSLSLVLMTLDVSDQSPEAAIDFRFLVEGYPQPSEIAAAMSPSRSKGYFSIIQPEYITECKITNSTDEMAKGKVTFNAPKLCIGSVNFEARKHEGTWRIEKFHLLSRQISIELGEDGNWRLAGKEAEEN